jgi:hypothetical protein
MHTFAAIALGLWANRSDAASTSSDLMIEISDCLKPASRFASLMRVEVFPPQVISRVGA